jgi:hypothetical protein
MKSVTSQNVKIPICYAVSVLKFIFLGFLRETVSLETLVFRDIILSSWQLCCIDAAPIKVIKRRQYAFPVCGKEVLHRI